MLRKLTVENFFSIKDVQTLDLEIARNATDPDGRFARPIERSDKRFPKVVTIFGANASGRTNLLRAIAFLAQFVRDSAAWRPEERLPFLAFIGKAGKQDKTKLSVELDGALFDWDKRVVFRYEVEVTSDAKQVISESLRYYPQGRGRWLFRRHGNHVHAGKEFRLPERDPVRSKLRGNTSVVSLLAQFNHPFSSAIYQSLAGVQTNVTTLGKQDLPANLATRYYNDVPSALDRLNAQIAKFDLGIERVAIEQGKDGVHPLFFHKGLINPLLLTFESHGTQRFYSEFPRLYHVLETGAVAVLDELDNDIHPLILPEILRLFQNKDVNPNDAQLIMSAHNATLLEHLVKEEVFFTQKDEDGRTEIYGLQDVKGVRRDTNIYAKYLAGVYGAVPRVA